MGKLLRISCIAQVALAKGGIPITQFLTQCVPALGIAAVQNHLGSLSNKTPRNAFTNTRGAAGN